MGRHLCRRQNLCGTTPTLGEVVVEKREIQMTQLSKRSMVNFITPQFLVAVALSVTLMIGLIYKPALFRLSPVSPASVAVNAAQVLPGSVVSHGIFDAYHNADLMRVGHYKVGKPYNIKGKLYHPKATYKHVQVGLASWYGPGFHGRKTANGETFDMYSVSAAHTTLQIPCVVKVTNLENNRELLVRINDRGPFHDDAKGERIIDLSYGAAQKLGFVNRGLARVKIEVMPEQSMMLAAACQNRLPKSGGLSAGTSDNRPGLRLAANTATKASGANKTLRQLAS